MQFFKKIKQKLFVKKNNIIRTTDSTPSEDPFYQHILYSLQRDKRAITISFLDKSDDHISMILDISPHQRTMIIDELHTPLGHELAKARVPFVAQAKYQGVSVLFASQVLETGVHEGTFFYKIKYPDKIDYLQRRQVERTGVPSSFVIAVEVFIPGLGWVKGRLNDFSIAGLQISFSRNLKRNFQDVKQMPVRLVSTHLPPQSFQLQLKHFRYDMLKMRTVVGGAFDKLDVNGLKYISSLAVKVS